MLQKLSFTVDGNTISYYLGHDALAEFADIVSQCGVDRLFIVADENVFALFGNRVMAALSRLLPVTLLPFVSGEPDKRVATLERLAIAANQSGITRQSGVMSLGGGATGNIAGLFAALMLRGIRFFDMPTSFLAMHDSATSLKQAVNLPSAKNQLGVYYAPQAVLVDTAFLDRLPAEHFWAGMVELVKNALVLDDEYRHDFDALTADIASIQSRLRELGVLGINAKMKKLEIDPHERREALVFEYGHTLGHAIEAAYYPQIHHGRAVYLGMRAAAKVALRMGLMTPDAYRAHEKRLALVGEPMKNSPDLDIERVLNLVPRDNKRGYRSALPGCVDMVLLSDIGKPILDVAGRPLTSVPFNLLGPALEG